MRNYRRLFALLMAAVMLLGMMPMAHAELAGCNHDWDGGKWVNGAPAHCRDYKVKRYTCTICGATDDNREVGKCVAGPKTWIRPQASTCLEHGVWEICCKYCGEWMDGMEEPGPHKWVTETLEQPGCDSTGWKESFCAYCGDEKGDGQEIPALGHDWGSWYWVDGAPSCTEGAWQNRECKRCGQLDDR